MALDIEMLDAPLAATGADLNAAASHVFPTNVDDEYDPNKPNDYAEVQSRREFEKAAQRRADELAEEMRDMQREREELTKTLQSEDAHALAALPTGIGRSRRGMDLMPAWMKARLQSETDAAAISSTAQIADEPSERDLMPPSSLLEHTPAVSHTPAASQLQLARGSVVSSPVGINPGSSAPNKALRMMQHWGYREGAGLGRREAGIIAPLQHIVTGTGAGLVTMSVDDQKAAATGTRPAAIAALSQLTESPVVLILNMVRPGEVDSDLEEEVRQECESKYGPASSVLVFECAGSAMPASEAVRIFVAFRSQTSAAAAIAGLNGRFFGGRPLVAKRFDEGRFRKFDLAPAPGE
jgi:splicing factor 45